MNDPIFARELMQLQHLAKQACNEHKNAAHEAGADRAQPRPGKNNEAPTVCIKRHIRSAPAMC